MYTTCRPIYIYYTIVIYNLDILTLQVLIRNYVLLIIFYVIFPHCVLLRLRIISVYFTNIGIIAFSLLRCILTQKKIYKNVIRKPNKIAIIQAIIVGGQTWQLYPNLAKGGYNCTMRSS